MQYKWKNKNDFADVPNQIFNKKPAIFLRFARQMVSNYTHK